MITFQLPLGQSEAELGVGGAGIPAVKVMFPLLAGMFVTGPVTLFSTTGCPGATLPPLFWQTNVAVTESAVRKAAEGLLPSPAAFPLQVRPLVSDLVQVGVRTNIGFWAWAAVANRIGTSSMAGAMMMKRMRRNMVASSELNSESACPPGAR